MSKSRPKTRNKLEGKSECKKKKKTQTVFEKIFSCIARDVLKGTGIKIPSNPQVISAQN